MRRFFAGLVAAALLLSLMGVSASAHGYHHRLAMESICGGFKTGCIRPDCVGMGAGNGGFVDSDNDGVCDNYDPLYCPGNGTGNCVGGGFVDNDNDGVCDNYDPDNCPGNGPNCGYGGGSGNAGAGNGGAGSGNGAGSGSSWSGGHHGGNHGRHHG